MRSGLQDAGESDSDLAADRGDERRVTAFEVHRGQVHLAQVIEQLSGDMWVRADTR